MDAFEKYQRQVKKHERCEGCRYRRKINAQAEWWFYACYCEPYNGKWIAEIEECPVGKEVEEA